MAEAFIASMVGILPVMQVGSWRTGERPFCFDGCNGLFGDEDPLQTGICVAESPIGTSACE